MTTQSWEQLKKTGKIGKQKQYKRAGAFAPALALMIVLF